MLKINCSQVNSIMDNMFFCEKSSINIFLISYDIVKIANDQNYTLGEYCGRRTGQTVAVYGNFALITFHSNPYVEKRGFFFHFKTVSAGLYSY